MSLQSNPMPLSQILKNLETIYRVEDKHNREENLKAFLSKAIEISFAETRVEEKDFRTMFNPSADIEGEEYTQGCQDTLSEVKKKEEYFLKN